MLLRSLSRALGSAWTPLARRRREREGYACVGSAFAGLFGVVAALDQASAGPEPKVPEAWPVEEFSPGAQGFTFITHRWRSFAYAKLAGVFESHWVARKQKELEAGFL